VAMLVQQFGLDRRYLDMVRNGEIAVRGHIRAGIAVEPYVRSRPHR
jgi:hypothetical protein